MKNLPDLAEHSANLCVGALAIGGATAAGLSGVAVPLAALAAIGLQLRGSCARRGGEKAARAVLEALVAARDLSEQDAARALDLMKAADVSRGLTTGQFAAAARDVGPTGDVPLALGAVLAAQMTEQGDTVRAALSIAFAAAIGVLRRDEDFHRELTQDMLIALLQGQGLQSRSQEDIQRKLDALSRDYHTLAEALKEHQRLRRDEMEAIASRFEIVRVYDLTDAELREQLELRAADYRRFQGQIEAIDERTRGLGNLKAAARDAAARLDFAEVEALLSRVDETETEIAAETKVLRANTALLRGRSEEAFNILFAAAASFGSIGEFEPARRQVDWHKMLFAHGTRYGGKGMVLAEEMLRSAISQPLREANPELWAEAQNQLGMVVSARASVVSGDASTNFLQDARRAYDAALEIWTEEKHPSNWASVQHNLANLLRISGERALYPDCIYILTEAVEKYFKVLEIWNINNNPEKFAKCNNNLACVLGLLLERIGSDLSEDIFNQAHKAFQASLNVWTPESDPSQWAMVQSNLGNLLRGRGEHLPGKEGLELLDAAVKAFRLSLNVRTEKEYPLEWSMTQSNLGSALAISGERRGGTAGGNLLREAAAAWHAALRIRTEISHPVDWAVTTGNLGRVHEAIAENETGLTQMRILNQAAAFYEAVLRVYDPETMQFDHARISEALLRVQAKLAALPDPA